MFWSDTFCHDRAGHGCTVPVNSRSFHLWIMCAVSLAFPCSRIEPDSFWAYILFEKKDINFFSTSRVQNAGTFSITLCFHHGQTHSGSEKLVTCMLKPWWPTRTFPVTSFVLSGTVRWPTNCCSEKFVRLKDGTNVGGSKTHGQLYLLTRRTDKKQSALNVSGSANEKWLLLRWWWWFQTTVMDFVFTPRIPHI